MLVRVELEQVLEAVKDIDFETRKEASFLETFVEVLIELEEMEANVEHGLIVYQTDWRLGGLFAPILGFRWFEEAFEWLEQ